MKGVPIKFRGKSVKTGEYVYGYFGRSNSGKALIVNMDATKATIVEEESVAQLVGYDEKDKEVYEGDTVGMSNDDRRKVELCFRLIDKPGLDYRTYFVSRHFHEMCAFSLEGDYE